MSDATPEEVNFRLDCGCEMVWVYEGKEGDEPPKPGDHVVCVLKEHKDQKVIWASNTEYNTEERVAFLAELNAKTQNMLDHLANMYQVGVDPSDQAPLRMETLIDFMLPNGTPARLEFSIAYQLRFQAKLESVRADLSRQRLTLPGSNGFRPRNHKL